MPSYPDQYNSERLAQPTVIRTSMSSQATGSYASIAWTISYLAISVWQSLQYKLLEDLAIRFVCVQRPSRLVLLTVCLSWRRVHAVTFRLPLRLTDHWSQYH